MSTKELHHSRSQVPAQKRVKCPIRVQTSIPKLLMGKFLRKYGIMQLFSYHLTKRRTPEIIFPYMPERIKDNQFLYDFHTHSSYSDGEGTYKDILTEIRQKKHLDGMAITDHPWHLGKDKKTRIPDGKVLKRSYKFHELVEDLKKRGKLKENFITFPGSCEFFTRLNEDYHDSLVELIALGLPLDFIENQGGIQKITDGYAADFIEKVHENNGLVIIPHPFYFVRAYELLKHSSGIRPRPDAFEAINYTVGFLADESYHDFLEKFPFPKETKSIGNIFGYFNWMASIIAQNNDFGEEFDYPIARQIAPVGSSDAHFHSMVGAAATLSEKPIKTFEDLRQMFKRRKTQPVYNPLWRKNTNKFTVFREIWESHGDEINKGLTDKSKLYWITSKVIIDLLSLILNGKSKPNNEFL